MDDLPEIKTDSELDDTQGVEIDLEVLFNKFILPIDKARSFAAAPMVERPIIADGNSVANDAANAADIDPSAPQESRTHAFYRMIGFPVIGTSSFYSPGFDPTLKADERSRNYNTSSNVPSPVRDLQVKREVSVRERMKFFRKLSLDACVYAIAMGVPNGIKPFLQMNSSESFNFLTDTDPQIFTKKEREDYIKSRYRGRISTDGSELEITNFFSEGNHILRPFNTDPNITDTVTGFSNETRIVAAPFLPSKGDTGIERSIYTKRPGIEFILRLRLREQGSTDLINSTLLTIEDFSISTSEISNAELSSIVSALLNKDGASVNSDDIIERLKNSHRTQLININKLVKIIKAVIDELIEATDNIKNVSKKIRWTPLPSETGPEGGCDTTNLIVPKQKAELERTIKNLELRSLQSSEIGTLSDENLENSDFHLSQFENTEKTWVKELADAKECRDNNQRLGSDSLTAVEVITGEVSGLGLVDVLAIYSALWAIDIEVLISMLDENAFDRLYVNNPDLRSVDVELRRSNGPQLSIAEAIQAFEKQVINILSYADKIYQDKLGAPANGEGGNLPHDQDGE